MRRLTRPCWQVLAEAFTNHKFAPRLKILWLSDNCITDAGADALGGALQSSLMCLTEICLFRCVNIRMGDGESGGESE